VVRRDPRGKFHRAKWPRVRTCGVNFAVEECVQMAKRTIPTIPTDEHYTAIETFSVVGARKLIDEQVELIESNKKLIESSYCFNPNI
jgi:hypothetical protein